MSYEIVVLTGLSITVILGFVGIRWMARKMREKHH